MISVQFITRSMLCALLFSGLCAQHVYAQGTCAPVVHMPDVIQTLPYDPFSPEPLMDFIPLEVKDNFCDTASDATIVLGVNATSFALTYEGQELVFDMSVNGVDISNFDSANNTPILGATLALPSQSQGLLSPQVRLRMLERQIVAPGLYSFFAPAIAESRSGLLTQIAGSDEIRAQAVTIRTRVLPVMNLAVTGCDIGQGGAQDGDDLAANRLLNACSLTLGDPSAGLREGDMRRARINARTNVHFLVEMISANGGVLKRLGAMDGSTQTDVIQYSARLESGDGANMFDCQTNNCGTIGPIQPRLNSLGTDLFFQIRVTDPEINRKRAGTFTDSITLIIKPAS
ncbi:MAG: hypothetical protein HC777_02780 [Hyphomonadaceae bacterium]|nr:hypothetical protein [Hyphomonadaceae bacterium]